MALSNVLPSNNFISNGVVTLDENLNDYPRLTVTEYTQNTITRVLGSSVSYADLVFTLESITENISPVKYNQNRKEITYGYSHISKLVYEYPVKARDFLDANKSSFVRKTEDSYVFSVSVLVKYVQRKISIESSVVVPNFTFELSLQVSNEEVITIKQYVDSRLEILGLVYNFKGSTLSFKKPGSSGYLSSYSVSNFTLARNNVATYKDTVLNWSKNENYDNTDLTKKYIKTANNSYILYEGSYQPHLPPPETKDGSLVPRDLSIMIDNSGLTKSCKITKYSFNQPDVEINATFGYAHAALELVDDPERPNAITETVLNALSEDVISSGNAYQEVLRAIKSGKYGYPDDAAFTRDLVWRLISITKTTYKYEPLRININPRIKKEDGTLESVTVPAEYQQYLQSNCKVLVSEVTEGWELKRFAQEDPSEWTNGSIESWLNLKTIISLKDTLKGTDLLSKQQYYWMLYFAKINLEQYLYRKIPVYERVDYALAPYSRFYKEEDEVDWQIVNIPKNQLSSQTNQSDSTPVPVLFPDPNWEPKLVILARSRLKSSVGLSGNPNFDPWSRNYFGSNPITVVTGTEEYELTKYSILPSKNTRPNIGNSYSSYNNINDVLSKIQTDIDSSGTYYNPHPYMDVSDYGIEDVPISSLSMSSVSGSYPNNNLNREDQYTTTTTLRIAQDHSYKSRVANTTYALSEGRPPSATIIKPVFEEVANKTENKVYNKSTTFITSNLKSLNNQYKTSVSIAGAENINEAIKAAEFQLILDSINQGNTVSAQLNFTEYRGKPLINYSFKLKDLTGDWVVKRASQSIHYVNGKMLPQLVSIEAGIIPKVSITTKTVSDASETPNSDTIKVLINPDLPNNFGTPIEQIPDNFGRWVDTN